MKFVRVAVVVICRVGTCNVDDPPVQLLQCTKHLLRSSQPMIALDEESAPTVAVGRDQIRDEPTDHDADEPE